MSTAIQTVCSSEACRASTDDSYLLITTNLRDARLQVTLLESGLDDKELIIMHGHRLCMLPLSAGLLAQSRAYTTSKFREAIGLLQAGVGIGHLPLVDTVIPLRDQIMKGTPRHHAMKLHARLAERYATVHAASRLLHPLLIRQHLMEVVIILHALHRRDVSIIHSAIFHKSSWFSHDYSPIYTIFFLIHICPCI